MLSHSQRALYLTGKKTNFILFDKVFLSRFIIKKFAVLFDSAGLSEIQKVAYSLAIYFNLLILIIALPFFQKSILITCTLFILLLIIKIKHIASKRVIEFEDEYPSFLISLSSAVRAGNDLYTSIVQAQNFLKKGSALNTEISKMIKKVNSGSDFSEAVKSFGYSVNLKDISLFRSALILSSKEGSSISRSLHRLAVITRQRQSFRRKIRGALVMQKISAFGMIFTVLFVGVFQMLSNPDGYQKVLEHPLGLKSLSLSAVLILIGTFWITKICSKPL